MSTGTSVFESDRYVVPGLEMVTELGRGAGTVVWRTRRQGVDYALKMLTEPVPYEDERCVAFRREAAMLARVNHPALPRIHDVGYARGRPFLVMQLVAGQELETLLADTAMEEADAVRLAVDVAGALAAAHRAGLVHRDVKPRNIIVLPDGHAKLIDFGLVTWAVKDKADAVAGSLPYMAPEQTGMLNRVVDGRSDLYGLGVTLFRCLAARPPFTSRDGGELMRLHMVAPPPDLRNLCPEVSPVFAAIVAKLLEKDPDSRYQSGEGLIADLERLLADGGDTLFPLDVRDRGISMAEARLVGRELELAELLSRWDRARAGRGGAALVRGAAGAGKTRLVREVANEVRRSGCLVLEGKGVSDGATPLAPLRSAVDGYLQAVSQLPEPERHTALGEVRAAASPMGPLVATLSPALADLLGTNPPHDDAPQDQFTNAVASFLIRLARRGAVLCLDDVQWLDAGTLGVLRNLSDDLPGSGLLLLATSRDDDASEERVEAFVRNLRAALDTQMQLTPLADESAHQLLADTLGGGAVAPAFTRLAARCGGNPFTLGEYLRAAIDAGLIRPSWGIWELEERGLEDLTLAPDVLDVIVSRADGLGPKAKRQLATAAVIGMKFRPDHLARVYDVDDRQILDVIAVAVDRRLVAATATGEYTFVHDRVREALLAAVKQSTLRRWHQRIAEVLDGTAPSEPEQVYAAAWHYQRGEMERAPQRVFAACFEAGRMALAQYAPSEGLGYLETALTAAAQAGIEADSTFHAVLGEVYLRTGHLTESFGPLNRALTTDSDRHHRAKLYGQIAEAHDGRYQFDDALAAARLGLAELGRPLPKSRILLGLSTAWLCVVGLMVKWLRIGFGTAAGDQRERYRLQCWLNSVAADAAALRRDLFLSSCLTFRQLYPGNRLGNSLESVRAYTQFAGAMLIIHWKRASRRLFQSVRRTAAGVGDPRAIAYVAWMEWTLGMAMRGNDVAGRDSVREILTEHGRWLTVQEYIEAALCYCVPLTFCGYPRESSAWHERVSAAARVGMSESRYTVSRAGNLAMLGRDTDALDLLGEIRSVLIKEPFNRDSWGSYLTFAVWVAVEQSKFEHFEAAIDDLRRVDIRPRRMWPIMRPLFAFVAQGRLAQCLAAPEHERAERLRAARAAIRDLRRAASTPLLRAHYEIASAAYRQLTGEPRAALRRLDRAEQIARWQDAPVLQYEIARVRARTLRTLGHSAEASREAAFALKLAADGDWHYRARWIRQEFGIEVEDTPFSDSTPRSISGELNRRRLDALQQVNLASATILDPHGLARVALDEILVILGAERAFLFLVDGESGRLEPQMGRDAAGTDIVSLSGYATSLVQRVYETGQPLMTTSDDEGTTLTSQSTAAFGLLSVMAAPLHLKGQLRGVVYLDSRIAKGVFTDDDVNILLAIASQVAVSLETARAAQLEAAVQAAKQQRDLAETLRSAMSRLSQTLIPMDVLRQMLATAAQIVPADAAYLVRRTADAATVALVHGPVEVGRDLQVDLHADRTLASLMSAGGATQESRMVDRPAPLPELLPTMGSWIATPLTLREGPTFMLIVASNAEHAFTDADVEIEAALCEQAMVAYQTARLFQHVRTLAHRDGLTGLYNRRHVMERADDRLTEARPTGRGFAALMVDIDNFKRINDRYGHSTGDEVLREVAARLRTAVRDGDLVGRYGGEEFVFFADSNDGAKIAERIRLDVARAPVALSGEPVHATISVGVAQLSPHDSGLEELLSRADGALYVAKRQGRNCVFASNRD